MRLRIAQIAPLWVPVPPRTYGGTEYVVSILTEELIKRGHKVTLFASGDSQTSAELISTCEKSIWRSPELLDPHACIMHLLGKTVRMADEFDIIHNHAGFYTVPFAPYFKKPLVMTLHRPLAKETLALLRDYPNITYVALSQNQAQSANGLPIKTVIPNGIPIERYPFGEKPKDYVLWLSKITKEKGIEDAILGAHIAGVNIILAGNIVGFEDQRFFLEKIQPLIDGQEVQYVGQVDFATKIELMANAKAFLFPVDRQEPFGLVAIEALACGTPVIAYPNGAIPEIIKDGQHGFLVRNIRGIARAISQIDSISRESCRKRVEEKFTHQTMVDRYEALYKEILNH